jgi:hypothetical protein
MILYHLKVSPSVLVEAEVEAEVEYTYFERCRDLSVNIRPS